MASGNELWKKIGDKICARLAARNPAGAILAVYRLCACLGKMTPENVEEHYRHNTKVWDERRAELEDTDGDGKVYLEYQRRLGSADERTPLYFGMRRRKGPFQASYNSCEAIALYNLQLFMDREGADSFPEWTRRFERKGIALGGLMGSSVSAIKTYIEEMGLRYDSLVGKSYETADLEEFCSKNKAFIVNLINNRETMKSGIHTMCITTAEENGSRCYLIHNDYATYGKQKFRTLREVVDSYNKGRGAVIELIGVRPVGE